MVSTEGAGTSQRKEPVIPSRCWGFFSLLLLEAPYQGAGLEAELLRRWSWADALISGTSIIGYGLTCCTTALVSTFIFLPTSWSTPWKCIGYWVKLPARSCDTSVCIAKWNSTPKCMLELDTGTEIKMESWRVAREWNCRIFFEDHFSRNALRASFFSLKE